MGFTKADFPPVDPETFLQQPLMERMKVLALHWVEHGFGSPRMIHTIYVVKLLFFYALGGAVVATWTSHLPPFWDIAGWGAPRLSCRKRRCWGPCCARRWESPDPGVRWPASSSR